MYFISSTIFPCVQGQTERPAAMTRNAEKTVYIVAKRKDFKRKVCSDLGPLDAEWVLGILQPTFTAVSNQQQQRRIIDAGHQQRTDDEGDTLGSLNTSSSSVAAGDTLLPLIRDDEALRDRAGTLCCPYQ